MDTKKLLIFIIFLAQCFLTNISAKMINHLVVFSYYQRPVSSTYCGLHTCKPPHPILIKDSYSRNQNTYLLSVQFGLRTINDLGNGNFGYPDYLTSQKSSKYYKALRKKYLYISSPDTLLFNLCHHNRSEICEVSFELDTTKS